MSEPTKKLVTNLNDAFLECPVCFDAFNLTDRRPRLLHKCLHAFCTGCLDTLIQKEGGGRLTCPVCRHVAKVKGKATSFPADPVRSKLLDFIKMKKEKKALCSDCPDGHEADSRCQKCSLFLCKECRYVHKRHKMTSDHSILDLEQVLEQPLKQLSTPHFCTKHPGSELEFFCSIDESFCCASCIVLNHQGHKFAKTEEALIPWQRDLDNRLQETKKHALCLRDQRQRVETNKTGIVQNKMAIKSKIQKEFSKLVRMIEIKKESLLEEIDQHSHEKVAVCDKKIQEIDENLAMIESTQTYITQANKNLDALDMVQLLPALKHSLAGLSPSRSCAAERTPRVVFYPYCVSTAEKIIPLIGRLEVKNEADKPCAFEYKDLVLQCLSMCLESNDKAELNRQINRVLDVMEQTRNTHFDCAENKDENTITNTDCSSKEKEEGSYNGKDGATPNTDHSASEAKEENEQNSGYGCRRKIDDATTVTEPTSGEVLEDEKNRTELGSYGKEEELSNGDIDPKVLKKENKPKTDYGSKWKRGEGKPDRGFVFLERAMRQDLIDTNIGYKGRDVKQTGTKAKLCLVLGEEVQGRYLGRTHSSLILTPDLSSTEEFEEDVQDQGERGHKPKVLKSVCGEYGGRMTSRLVDECCEGYENSSSIEIRYHIPADTITKRYIGVDYIAYLPDNEEGRKLLLLLEVAWKRGLTLILDEDMGKFKLQIMHKPFLKRSSDRSLSYPDSTYLKRLQGKLHELGLTEYDI